MSQKRSEFDGMWYLTEYALCMLYLPKHATRKILISYPYRVHGDYSFTGDGIILSSVCDDIMAHETAAYSKIRNSKQTGHDNNLQHMTE